MRTSAFALVCVTVAITSPARAEPDAKDAPLVPPTSSSTPPEEQPALPPGMVKVHIDTDDPKVQLHRYRGSSVGLVVVPVNAIVISDYSNVVCRAPCDRVVDGRDGEEYFFAGSGLSSSGRFQLYDRTGTLEAKVNPGSNTLRWVGIGAALAGIAPVLGGAGMLAIGSDIKDDFPDEGSRWKTIGAVAIGVGTAMIIGGIVLWLSGRTTYELASTTRDREHQSAL